MNKKQLVVSIRQLCLAGCSKLDVMVKPEVVVSEYRKSLAVLKMTVDDSHCNRKTKAEMYGIIRKANDFDSVCKRDAYALRGKLSRIERALPSLIEMSKGKLI